MKATPQPGAVKLPYPQTPESAKAWFKSHGISQAEWVRDLKLERSIVVDLLRGRLKGVRGQAHHAAIALGLKPSPNTENHAA